MPFNIFLITMIVVNKPFTPPYEVVERKGLGHPDTLADGISEAISRSLCRHYLEESGQILHHNVDKVLIIAGQSAPLFGGGSILKPPSVVVGGRASRLQNKPLSQIIEDAAASHLHKTVKNLEQFHVEPRLEQGAPELQSLIGRGANDTSIGVGYAPLSRTERLVLDLENVVREVRGTGEDIKLMAVRRGGHISLVVAVAMVSRFIGSRQEYEEAKLAVRQAVERKAQSWFEKEPGEERYGAESGSVEVHVNCADAGENIYLTVSGCSLEMGDDGATGRGNRGNGLITPMRPMTMEAIAGKNPVSHVGKIYNVMAQKAAADIAEMEGVAEAYVTLVSRIGSPISQPLLRGVQIGSDMKMTAEVEAGINSILDWHLENSEDLVEQFVQGKLTLF
ncbi:MAG: S-adenosylmethionine synthetase [Methanosaeta sp. NSM2]|nr:MAG: S-adenosylmethionine synthetase [Methanosaeta sp. NSM2]